MNPPLGEPVLIDETVRTIGLIPLIAALITVIINIAFAIGVYRDSASRRTHGFRLWFAAPIFWAGATLVGSVFVAALYWLIHYSTLTREPEEAQHSSE